jgi:restriction system protein
VVGGRQTVALEASGGLLVNTGPNEQPVDRQRAAFAGDEAFHFQPDLLSLLVDTIPRLVRTKREVLLFFRGAGVPEVEFHDLMDLLTASPGEVNKYGLAREVLARLNAAGDPRISARREVIRRVVEFEDFTACYENERDAAKARVAEVRRLVDAKDSFTRMRIEREREREGRTADARLRLQEVADLEKRRESVRRDLFALFAEPSPYVRARGLETVLNRLFALDGIAIREAFTLTLADGTTAEQIDGAIEVDSQLYLVEMKWRKDPVDIVEVSRHLARLFSRADCGGLVIASSGFTEPAIHECRQALRSRTIVLCGLDEIVRALENGESVEGLLRSRIRRAKLDKEPIAN